MNLRKTVNIFVLVLACAIIMAGCNQGSPGNTSLAVQNGDNRDSVPSDGDRPDGTPAASGEGSQLQQPDLAGEIVSASGNSISLKLIDLSSMPGMRGGQMDPGNRPQEGSSENPPPDVNGEGQPEGSQPVQRQPEGSQPAQGQPDGSQPGQRKMELTYTGETKTVTVPEDVSITLSGRRNDGEQQTVAVSELKQGEVLQVWYSDKDKEILSRVTVMSFGGFAPNSGTVEAK